MSDSSSGTAASDIAPRTGLDPRTPVVVGVGQASERLTDPDYAALGEADLAARAVLAAFADTGAGPVAQAIDTVASVRSFEVSTPMSVSPLGRPDNMPRAVSARTGMTPGRAIHEVTGGQSPQSLVTELGAEIAAGRCDGAVIVGAEAISTIRALTKQDGDAPRPDFTEKVGGQLEERGCSIAGITSAQEIRHGLAAPLQQYAILENARRHRIGATREAYARSMGELFAPMTVVAAANPHAAAPTERTATELVTPTEANRIVAEPYTRYIVSRDQVNQAAAVVVMSVAKATELGIDPSRWVFLHGHSSLREKPLMRRPDLSRGPASTAAMHLALDGAGISLADAAFLDIYSCFPMPVFNICDEFGLSADDPRGLTATGGLPFFGGPGNNYSAHGIAEIVERVRAEPGSYGVVAANGGAMSKYAVGVYSTTPAAWYDDQSARVQARLDAVPDVVTVNAASGPATIESYTVTYSKSGRPSAVVIGRLDDTGSGGPGARFIATVERGDDAMFELLASDEPIGKPVFARAASTGNTVTVSEDAMLALHPPVAPAFRESYEHVEIRRDGHVLEVVINRPEARNALNAAANAELDSVFDAYFADPDLWVAILTGAGKKAFSAGNDLAATAGAAGLDVPLNGFAGLTSRRDKPKPVIAAVNGFALGGGCEIAMACHLVVADESATFGLPEVKVGLAALAGGLVRLPAAVPGALARDMILTGRKLTAAQALDVGLISRVAPAGGALELAREVAAEILACSPASVRASIQAMEDVAGIADPIEAIEATSSVMDALLVSQDTVEGITAFVSKREPRWSGH